MSEIKLSVALVTRNRPEFLDRCLRNLRLQETQPFEVVVSDDSDDGLASKVREVAGRWDCRYIEGPRRGLYANRNNAALACLGTHVRTMDDDHELPEGHFRAVEAAVESDPESIWIIGEYGEKPSPSSRLGLPGEIQPRGFSSAPQDYDDCYAISDGATVYPRRVFDEHLFLDVFKFGHLYLEFGARLKSLGYRIRLCAGTYVIHHYVEAGRSFRDECMERKSSFLAAYLTYACHLPDLLRQSECICWFLSMALVNSFKEKPDVFKLSDFWETWKIGSSYKAAFERAKRATIALPRSIESLD